MKEKRITIKIKRPITEVFEFTINPSNTHLWVDSIVEEKADSLIGLGTKYVNKDTAGNVSEYIVINFEQDKVFELKSLNSDYHVKYTYKSVSPNETELEYFEWVDSSELRHPFNMKTLKKLKATMEG